ncbi:MAG: hypothetical protein AAFY26_19495 [Cyanobacteria bacterium J06638_22]
MGSILLVSNDKGGAGKSFFCRTLLQYFLYKETPFVCFDLDRSNPDVYRCMQGICEVRLAILSESERLIDSANAVFNAALENDVICNLPAQVGPALEAWIENNQLLDLAEEMDVQMRFFFVTDAGFEANKLFIHSVQRYGDRIPHTLVKNYGLTDDFTPIDNDPFVQELLDAFDIEVIALPKFMGAVDRNFIDANSLSFGEALTHPDLGPISRQRIKVFLRKAYEEFDRLSFLKPPVPQVEEPVKPKRTPRKKGGKA